MPQQFTKKRRRDQKALLDELDELREEKLALEFIRDCGHVFDALLFYSGQSHLTKKAREDIRLCMTLLARGGGI